MSVNCNTEESRFGGKAIHLLYLSKRRREQIASKQGTDDFQEDKTQCLLSPSAYLTFGYYDEVDEVVESPTDDPLDQVDYQKSFALLHPSRFESKELTAKQVITLVPLSKLDVYPENILDKLDLPICRTLSGQDDYPFLGLLFLSFNLLKNENSKSLDQRQREFSIDFAKICDRLRDENIDDYNNSKISSDALIRWYACANCADLCIAVNSWCLQDVFLVGKVVQSITGEIVTDQLSPLWSFAAVSSNVEWLNKHFEQIANRNQNITVDFRLSINDFDCEKEFLNVVPKKEDSCKEYAHTDLTQAKVGKTVERVGGVLGIGNYSVHLAFPCYLQFFLVRWQARESKDMQPCGSELVQFLCKEARSQHLVISNQRVRFCYQSDVLDGLSGIKKERGDYRDRSEFSDSDGRGQNPLKNIETTLNSLRRKLTSYRNKLPSNEYGFRECLAMISDLIYSYNELIYCENIHSYIFVTQMMALFCGIRNYLRIIIDGLDELQKRSNQTTAKGKVIRKQCQAEVEKYVVAMINDANRAVIAIDEYNRGLVKFTRSTTNIPIYGIQSKVNIEKYLIAYSMFLQQICDDYSQNRLDHKKDTELLLPFCYLDVHLNRVNVYTLFYWAYRQDIAIPKLLPVACPNYRRFANAYRLLPLLTHEISHQFRYIERTERNTFVLMKAMTYLAESLVNSLLLEMTASEDMQLSLRNEIVNSMASVLQNKLLESHGGENSEKISTGAYSDRISKESFRNLKGRILIPFCRELTCSFGGGERFYSVLEQERVRNSISAMMETAQIPILRVKQVEQIINQCIDKKGNACAAEKDGLNVVPLVCLSAMYWFFDRGVIDNKGENSAKKSSDEKSSAGKWIAALESCLNICNEFSGQMGKAWQTICSGLRNVWKESAELGAVFEIKHFRNLCVYLLQYALTNLLNGPYRALQIKWHAKAIMQSIEQNQDISDLNLSAQAQEVLIRFWKYYDEIMNCISSDAMTQNVFRMWNEAEALLSMAETHENVRSILIDFDDGNKSMSCVSYTRYMVQSFLQQIQEKIECLVQLWSSLKAQPYATIGNYDQKQLLNSLVGGINEISKATLKKNNLFATGTRKLLLKLADRETVAELLEKAVNEKNDFEWAEICQQPLDLYSEICADFGMCAVHKLTPMGYLIFVANQCVQEIDTSQRYTFRDQRCLTVVNQLIHVVEKTEKGKPVSHQKRVSHQQLHDEIRQFHDSIIDKMQDLAKKLPKMDLSSGEAFNQRIQDFCNKCKEFTPNALENEIELIEVHNNAVALEDSINTFGYHLREAVRALREKGMNVGKYQVNLRELSNLLRNVRMLRYILNVFSDTSLSNKEDEMKQEDANHYDKLWEKLEHEPWIKNLQKDGEDSFCIKVGMQYNQWSKKLNTSNDLHPQLDFVFEYYNKAHERYREMIMTSLKALQQGEDLKDEPTQWFQAYFANHGWQPQKEIPDGNILG